MMKYKELFNKSIDRLIKRKELSEDQIKELIRQEIRTEEIKNIENMNEYYKVKFDNFKEQFNLLSAKELAELAKDIIDTIYVEDK